MGHLNEQHSMVKVWELLITCRLAFTMYCELIAQRKEYTRKGDMALSG